ncbi:hypothetical protein [Mycobacterium sp. TY813]|uniref:hypothetical protein n=1 Tax=Mycobacterium TaxID=1763 RepID=UPI0027423D3A|nr:hypothetical protein [Mycobacterium sp. TY813]MDP7727625.1 hypothetical protein [Mycobacterium sp. TY813]
MTRSSSRAIRRFGTPAHLASLPGQPQRPPRYTQTELRERRRRGLPPGHYDGQWSLAAEIAAVANPLAERIAAADRPARFKLPVAWLAEDTHELVGTVVGWVAEAEARRRTQHLKDEPGKRRYAMTTFIDLQPRPALPDIAAKALASGAWAGQLIAMADDIDAAFSELLGRSYAPGADGLRGQASRSEQLARLLGRTIDRAALELQRRLDRADADTPAKPDQTDDDRRAALAALGVQT